MNSKDPSRLIGTPVDEVDTPALILDRAALLHNIALVADWSRERVSLRPHAKVHKCREIGRLQLESGAVGVTVATVAEATAMSSISPGSILVANEVVGQAKLERLMAVAQTCPLIVAVDSPGNAADLSRFATIAGVEIGVVVDVDVGMHRCGTRSIAETIDVANRVADLPGVVLRGAMGYEGQAVLIENRDQRSAEVSKSLRLLAEHVDALRGLSHSIDIVSAGGTNTYDLAGLDSVVTELQAGTYAIADTGTMRFSAELRPALWMAATVVSRSADTAVLDCGTKAVATAVFPPAVPPDAGRIREIHEEHMLIDPAGSDRLTYGEAVQLSVGYAGGTTNLHQAYIVVDDGAVVDIWPIDHGGGW